MDGMQLPYDTRCFRAQVLDRPRAGSAPADASGTTDAPSGTGEPPTADGPDDDLLIDFR
jgi:hypothetical protein